MSRACVLLAPGFEEIEAITIIDVLRRAAVETEVLAIADNPVAGSHGIVVTADAHLSERRDAEWDLVILPGGMPGAANLRDDPEVQALLRRQRARGGRLGAICAAPIALSAAGLLQGHKATSFPTFAKQLDCGEYLNERVVVDGDLTTSRGPGTAIDFALELVAQLRGQPCADQLRGAMLAER